MEEWVGTRERGVQGTLSRCTCDHLPGPNVTPVLTLTLTLKLSLALTLTLTLTPDADPGPGPITLHLRPAAMLSPHASTTHRHPRLP